MRFGWGHELKQSFGIVSGDITMRKRGTERSRMRCLSNLAGRRDPQALFLYAARPPGKQTLRLFRSKAAQALLKTCDQKDDSDWWPNISFSAVTQASVCGNVDVIKSMRDSGRGQS